MHNSSLLAVSEAKVLPAYLLYRSKFRDIEFIRQEFFFPFSFHGKERKSREKRGNLDQMVLPRLSSKHGFSVSKSLMETQTFQRRRGVNTHSSVSNRSLHQGPAW